MDCFSITYFCTSKLKSHADEKKLKSHADAESHKTTLLNLKIHFLRGRGHYHIGVYELLED